MTRQGVLYAANLLVGCLTQSNIFLSSIRHSNAAITHFSDARQQFLQFPIFHNKEMHFNPAIYGELSANKMHLISDVERYSKCIHNFLHFGFSLKMAFFSVGQEDNDNCSKC